MPVKRTTWQAKKERYMAFEGFFASTHVWTDSSEVFCPPIDEDLPQMAEENCIPSEAQAHLGHAQEHPQEDTNVSANSNIVSDSTKSDSEAEDGACPNSRVCGGSAWIYVYTHTRCYVFPLRARLACVLNCCGV
jgi:hypothetical protein